VDPSHPAIVHAATRDALFTSTDGGLNWQSVNEDLTFRDFRSSFVEQRELDALVEAGLRLAIDPLTPTTLYSASVDGI
jgi:hypothetical protein